MGEIPASGELRLFFPASERGLLKAKHIIAEHVSEGGVLEANSKD
jgi:hypothetical protein